MIPAQWLPDIFLMLMGVAVLIYAVLDGYDLGVGMVLPANDSEQRNQMIASIGPFWDANETWLVLAVGILLIAFPQAHNLVLRELYLPAALLMLGLILRGVSFDFRAKAVTGHRRTWDKTFKAGSWLAALTQGYMLGRYVLGFENSLAAQLFALLSAVCVSAAYAYIGGAWLVMKTEGDLQRRAACWSRRAGWLAALGIGAISVVNPLVSEVIAERWFNFPAVILLAPIPLVSLVLVIVVDQYLKHVPTQNDVGCWFPFIGVALLFVLSFIGLAYSFYPDVVPGRISAQEAASAEASLRFVGIGVAIVLPLILAYTAFAYRVFWGKSTELRYH
ncbi:cytochrome d ubiquinol oxidase subunit II [Saccharospirillum salsuginis]|uniref:Cytochrome bd ubiquinol oxidase subunit II n=1 Tax=Saccharospirillum salsuginis TaxID=418750 RepID=A0A918K479_9GAMM|nr:cytochrome d ubiquinol oxidase subunit II [Saccharospirillum salsuginis]GGX43401.1 cytochrome bd ubiquinol oxidase subunit II [Saccharospirillum salsuginis]